MTYVAGGYMNVNFGPAGRVWLQQQNGKGGPSAAARVARIVEVIALYRTGAIAETEFLQQMKQL
jgi:hypothetical protein